MQGRVIGQAVEVVDEGGDQRIERRQDRGPQQGERVGAGVGEERADSGDEVTQEDADVAVALVEGEPGAGIGTMIEPVAEQGGFAEAGRRADKRHRSVEVAVEDLAHPRPVDEITGRARTIQLGPQQMKGTSLASPITFIPVFASYGIEAATNATMMLARPAS